MTPSSRFLLPYTLLPVTSGVGSWRRRVRRNRRLGIQRPGLDKTGPGLTVLWRGAALHGIRPPCQVGPASVTPRTKGVHSKQPAVVPGTPSGLLGLGWARVTPAVPEHPASAPWLPHHPAILISRPLSAFSQTALSRTGQGGRQEVGLGGHRDLNWPRGRGRSLFGALFLFRSTSSPHPFPDNTDVWVQKAPELQASTFPHRPSP